MARREQNIRAYLNFCQLFKGKPLNELVDGIYMSTLAVMVSMVSMGIMVSVPDLLTKRQILLNFGLHSLMYTAVPKTYSSLNIQSLDVLPHLGLAGSMVSFVKFVQLVSLSLTGSSFEPLVAFFPQLFLGIR